MRGQLGRASHEGPVTRNIEEHGHLTAPAWHVCSNLRADRGMFPVRRERFWNGWLGRLQWLGGRCRHVGKRRQRRDARHHSLARVQAGGGSSGADDRRTGCNGEVVQYASPEAHFAPFFMTIGGFTGDACSRYVCYVGGTCSGEAVTNGVMHRAPPCDFTSHQTKSPTPSEPRHRTMQRLRYGRGDLQRRVSHEQRDALCTPMRLHVTSAQVPPPPGEPQGENSVCSVEQCEGGDLNPHESYLASTSS